MPGLGRYGTHWAWTHDGALEAARKGATGFADHLIAEISFESGAGEVITFDKAFGRMPGVRRLK